MKFKKALVINISEDKLDPVYWQRLRGLADKVVLLPKDSPQIQKELSDTDCILTGFQIDVGKKEIDGAPNLKYISVLATAYGKIDTDYAKKKGIVVSNVPGYATEAVAESVFAEILENIRDISKAKEWGRAHHYSEVGLKATEIKDKVFAVIGLGSIGRRVAEIAQGFGADVRYWSKHRKKDLEKKGIKYQDADKLISDADIISLNLAETPATKHFLSKKRIDSIKKDIAALEERLKKKELTFITDHSDEFDKEDEKRLSKYENCFLYPAIGYMTDEARIAKQEIFLGNMEGFLKGKPQNKVD